MLEIKNVTKIYKTKGGVDTKALDNVSISFPETGLVFLLGKSGSGKSTLLNVCGGLDSPTSGEIIVKGRSSKSFTGSDFDSYRNTFVGFIFQEYNVLDEFNVEDNIALALELQGKPKDKQRITELLQSVEMGAFAKRKPNTLSGGQKQRLAIARALIKDPQIIMADEPTGALDSNTGRQVLETLKTLSRTRLVIIVSHDREFAEIYGDRIVELSDGKIISDVTKSSVPAKAIDGNVVAVGDNTLKLKGGSALTAENMKELENFISNAEGDVIITKGENEIKVFSKAARIKDDGSTERFDGTDVKSIEIKQYSPEESKLIRSRLPAAKAIKIGASSLKLKPIRLLFTILLSVIAFTMFGLFSTLMLYDGEKVAAKSLALSDYDYLNIVRNYQITYDYGDGYSSSYGNATGVTEAELSELQSKFSSQAFGYYNLGDTSLINVKLSSKTGYWNNVIKKCAYVPEGHSLRTNLIGEYPKDKTEVCISTYLLNVIKNSEFYAVTPEKPDYGERDIFPVETEQDIIGKYLTVNYNGQQIFKVTGVFDCGTIPAKYDSIKDSLTEQSFILQYEFMNYMEESMNCLVLVSEDFAEEYGLYYFTGMSDGKEYFDYIFDDIALQYESCEPDYATDSWGAPYYNDLYVRNMARGYGKEDQLPVIFFNGKNTVGYNDVILDADLLPDLKDVIIRQLYDGMAADTDKFDYDIYYSSVAEYENFIYDYYSYINGISNAAAGSADLTQAEIDAMRSRICEFISALGPIDLKITVGGGMSFDFSIAGVYENVYGNDTYCMYLSQQFIDENLTVFEESHGQTNYVPTGEEKYHGVYIPYDHTESMAKFVINSVGIQTKNEKDLYFELNSELYQMVEMVNLTVKTLSIVFLVIGIVFAVFASLLMFNFISMSISSKRKEIGILRAVGARGADVFRIFFSESGIIIGICTVLAMILSVIVTSAINNVLKAEVGLEVTLFMFGFASVGIMIGIALLVAFIATFLPVYFAARKKPVEAIRAL